AGLWMALTADYTIAAFILGFIVSFIIIRMGQPFLGNIRYFRSENPGDIPHVLARLPMRVWLWTRFTVVFLWEVFKANIQVAIGVLSPLSRLRPGILAIPLDITTDAEITLFANMITLTPGTMSLDVSNDRRVLYVYFFNISDPETDKKILKDGFERMVMEVLQ
ncbi:MAG: Na+/H+ antiporter subunit E, partial [Blastochloris sp.]|nr:Na+/H+ antiporter subunit E [Blastochloris sp.]